MFGPIVIEWLVAAVVPENVPGKLCLAGIVQHSKMLAMYNDRIERSSIAHSARSDFSDRLTALAENRIARDDPRVVCVTLAASDHGLW